MALILVLCILALVIFIGVKLFKNNVYKITFIIIALIILMIPTYIVALNSFTSPFKLISKLAYTEGNLGYIEFLHDEYGEVKNKEVRTDILNKIDFYQSNVDEKINSVRLIEKKLPIKSIYLNKYIDMLNKSSNTLRVKQHELFLSL